MEPTPPPPVAATSPSSSAPVPVAATTIDYADFTKIQLRIATIVEARSHPNADKLLVLQIDLGDEKRQICAGIKSAFAPEALVGRQIVVVSNLAARPLRGEVSQGMLLAATDSATGNVVLLAPEKPVAPGSSVK